MNSEKIILLGCVAACVFAASTATAQMRGHGSSTPRMGMRGPPMSHSMARTPMQRAPMLNSASGFRRPFFNDRREDRFEARHPFFNDRREDRFEARHRFFNDRREDRFEARHPFFNDRLEDRLEARRFFPNRFVRNRSDFVFIGDFGFPGWGWGWGWGPWWGWGYPYGYYGGYGSAYGYGDSSGSRVAELQSRLARAGYYHGAIDGVMGPATRRALRAYKRNRGY
jgi:Putative peptidoglycan binding domain